MQEYLCVRLKITTSTKMYKPCFKKEQCQHVDENFERWDV